MPIKPLSESMIANKAEEYLKMQLTRYEQENLALRDALRSSFNEKQAIGQAFHQVTGKWNDICKALVASLESGVAEEQTRALNDAKEVLAQYERGMATARKMNAVPDKQ